MSAFRAGFPPGSVVCHRPHCAFTTSKQKMPAPHTFLEDELGSLLEVPLLWSWTANSSRHHVDSQEKPSHCLMALDSVLLLLGLLLLSPHGQEGHPSCS